MLGLPVLVEETVGNETITVTKLSMDGQGVKADVRGGGGKLVDDKTDRTAIARPKNKTFVARSTRQVLLPSSFNIQGGGNYVRVRNHVRNPRQQEGQPCCFTSCSNTLKDTLLHTRKFCSLEASSRQIQSDLPYRTAAETILLLCSRVYQKCTSCDQAVLKKSRRGVG